MMISVMSCSTPAEIVVVVVMENDVSNHRLCMYCVDHRVEAEFEILVYMLLSAGRVEGSKGVLVAIAVDRIYPGLVMPAFLSLQAAVVIVEMEVKTLVHA